MWALVCVCLYCCVEMRCVGCYDVCARVRVCVYTRVPFFGGAAIGAMPMTVRACFFGFFFFFGSGSSSSSSECPVSPETWARARDSLATGPALGGLCLQAP